MRKFSFLLLLAISLQLTAFSQYWQQQVDYTIDVSLDDRQQTLDGFERMVYANHSPDTLRFIWMHLWANAYKNDQTAFSDQLLENGNTSFYFSDKESKGYINRLDFKVDNVTAAVEDHPQHIDIIKLVLPTPLAPGQKVVITTPFHIKLPFNFSRGGHNGESYQVTQWYPKPAVYDNKGWHPMPYLEQGEFYSEFGSYDVNITVPANYVVAATGDLQDEEEKIWLKARAAFTWKPIRRKVKVKGGSVKTTVQEFPTSAAAKKTLHFKQDNVHDFAWFADKRFIVIQDSCQLPSGRTIALANYYTPDQKEFWQTSLSYSKRAVQFYSSEIGEYPYNTVSVVQGPLAWEGGMEYPTITIISPIKSASELEATIVHEIGHNWFYGILATNERDHPWMDEGINSYFGYRYEQAHHQKSQAPLYRIFFETLAAEKLDQPISTPSTEFSERNYFLSSYVKPALWLQYLRSQLTDPVFRKAFQDYFKQWQFKHPQPEDFKKAMEESSGQSLDSAFGYLDKKGILPTMQRSGTKTGFIFDRQFYESYLAKPSKDILLLGPAFGANAYDKLMVGAFVTNLKLPPSKLQFLLAPMYGTGSKTLTGIGFIDYHFFPGGIFRKINVGVSAAKFSMDEFNKAEGGKVYFGVQKLVPTVRFTFNEKNPRSTLEHFIQWKTYLFREQTYRISYDSVFNPSDTVIKQVVNTVNNDRVLNQLRIVINNYRALYPYRGELIVEQANQFVRTSFTGNYFFNYAKEGGLDVRFFAGKFFYTGSKTLTKQFQTDRYHLNLAGANGYEDYTYSDYFIGRNKFEGAASQQIMARDGAFKIRTDLLGNKIGKTDDWLVAVNFSTTIPKKFNPLSLLPVKIPLKIFADVGTYAEAWERNSNEDRFLFDAGIHIPILKETINIYLPLVYSSVFKDYVHSYLPKKNRFLKTISFTIDISHFNIRKFDRNYSL